MKYRKQPLRGFLQNRFYDTLTLINASKITVNQLIFWGRIGIDLHFYYSQTLSQEFFKHVCFKHFKEPKYYYDRTLANKNEASFFLNDKYSFFMKQKLKV